jgi:hypothetical protein
MPSSIDICSNALLLIGDNPINSFSDPGAGAQAAANLYPQVKERFLSTHPWSFALKHQRMSLLTAQPDPLTGYKYAYQMPTDLIRLWSIAPHQNYTVVGDSVLMNTNIGVLATYVYSVPETSIPAHAVKALEFMLASEFSISVTEDENKAQLYNQKATIASSQAMTIDSQGRPQVAIVDSPFVNARFGRIGGGGF